MQKSQETFKTTVLILIEINENDDAKNQLTNTKSELINRFNTFCAERKIIAHSCNTSRLGYYSGYYSPENAKAICDWLQSERIRDEVPLVIDWNDILRITPFTDLDCTDCD